MAVDFKVEHTRTSEYLFLPEDITIDPKLNGRYDAPDITELKASILEHGQLQPVAVRNDGGKPVLVMGFSRWTAISEINKDIRKSGEGDPIKIRAVYVRLNEQDGFIANWEENRRRNATTPLDDAHHFAQLEKWGRTEDEIAGRLHVSVSTVRARLALVGATKEVQEAVHDGRLKPTAAVKIAKLAAEQQRAAVKRNNGTGKITSADVAAATGATIKPSLKTVRDLVQVSADDTTLDRDIRQFCTRLLALMDGTSKEL
jgi:ParB family chromosome partitioning protein